MATESPDASELASLDQRIRLLEQKNRPQFPGDLDAVTLDYTADATADVEVSLNHSLQRVPTGFLVLSIDAAGVVYKTETPWTATKLFLKCSAAGARVKLLLF